MGASKQGPEKDNRAGCSEEAHSGRVKPDPMAKDLVPSVCSWVMVEPRKCEVTGLHLSVLCTGTQQKCPLLPLGGGVQLLSSDFSLGKLVT